MDMVGRVAKAISLSIWGMDYTPRVASHAPDARHTYAQEAARAAIAAMREPTEAMYSGAFNPDLDAWTEIWRAMIDAALSPTQEAGRDE